MTQKQFSLVRIIIAIIIAVAVSYSVSVNNYYLPIAIILVGMVSLYLIKKRVKDVIADERDYKVAGDSARYAVTTYSLLACLAFFVLYALRDLNPYYETIALTLAYSVCFLILLNGLIFRFNSRARTKKQKNLFIILEVICLLVLIIAGLRLFSGEDNWICQNGQWIEHGHPSFPAPEVECRK
jgi:uncharacterized membrane protein